MANEVFTYRSKRKRGEGKQTDSDDPKSKMQAKREGDREWFRPDDNFGVNGKAPKRKKAKRAEPKPGRVIKASERGQSDLELKPFEYADE